MEVWVGSKRHIDLAVLWYVVAAFGGMRNARVPDTPASVRVCPGSLNTLTLRLV